MIMEQQQSKSTSSSDPAQRLGKIEMALEGLRNVIKANPGVEIQCIGHFKLLFALLRLENCGRMQQFTLEVSFDSNIYNILECHVLRNQATIHCHHHNHH
jgi:DnaJ family protein C protein 13